MDGSLIVLVIFIASIAVLVAVLLVVAHRLRRKAKNLRAEISRQRRDALRSINLMLQQMDYDAEVLRLLRHARASRERGNETDFNGALDTLVTKEREMMERVDRVAEFEGYLQQTYSRKGLLGKLGRERGAAKMEQEVGSGKRGIRADRETAGEMKVLLDERQPAELRTSSGNLARPVGRAFVPELGPRAKFVKCVRSRNCETIPRELDHRSSESPISPDGQIREACGLLSDKSGERDDDAAPPATPEDLKSDIQKFIRDLERVRGGEVGLLDEKISFFERWVEGPERQDILRSLRAMALFLDKGDASELEKLKNEGAAGRG